MSHLNYRARWTLRSLYAFDSFSTTRTLLSFLTLGALCVCVCVNIAEL